MGTCEERVQILLHIRIDLGDILNISTTVASLDIEMKKGIMSKTEHWFNGSRITLNRKPELLISELSEVRNNLLFASLHNSLFLSLATETQVSDKRNINIRG